MRAANYVLDGPTDKHVQHTGELDEKKRRLVDGAPNRVRPSAVCPAQEDTKGLHVGITIYVLCECPSQILGMVQILQKYRIKKGYRD